MCTHRVHSRILEFGAGVLAMLFAVHAPADIATWTGAGTDDRWANTGNWEGGVLPTAADDIAFADVSFWQHPELHTTVTIDAPAYAHLLSFYYYGGYPAPFTDIELQPGARFELNEEHIDQSTVFVTGQYSQSGGVHQVATDFSYTSHGGQFSMTDGLFVVGGNLSLRPEMGSVSVSGGHIEAGSLQLHAWRNSYALGGTATVSVEDSLSIGGMLEAQTVYLGCPIVLRGADYVNSFHDWDRTLVNLVDSRFTFETDGATASLFECASADVGSSVAAFTDNFALGRLDVGDAMTGWIRLVDDVDNQSGADEATYVSDLYVGIGSILDLNGKTMYVRDLVTLDGVEYYASDGYREFLPGAYAGLIGSGGQVILIPEPAGLASLLLAVAAVACRRGISFRRDPLHR